MENTLASVILPLKKIAQEHYLSAQRIYDMLEANGDHVSLSTIKKLLAPGSENQSFNYYQSVEPIARVLYALEEEKHESEKDRIIAEQAEKIKELKRRNDKREQAKKKKTKSKYTMRADGLLVMSRVIEGRKRYFYGHSDKELEQKYAEALKEEERKKSARSFETVADLWWGEKENQISPNSVNGFKVCKKNAVDEFGDTPVDQITPRMIITYLQRYAAQGYSQKSIANRKSVLKSILDYAFVCGDIDHNPCSDLPIIKGKQKTPRQPASDEDIKLIGQHKNDSDIARMYYFMLYTGLRRGEAAALQYKHIDRKNKTVRVEQSCAWDNSKAVLKQPKTEAGVRTVALIDAVFDVLPEGHDPEEYVFFPAGLPRRRFIEKGFEIYRKQTGVTATPHQLRHSYATLLHSAGIDVKDAQSLLGHSTIIMTQDIYTHLEQAHEKEVRNKLNRYVKKSKKL